MPARRILHISIATVLIAAAGLCIAVRRHPWADPVAHSAISQPDGKYEIVSTTPEFPVATDYGNIDGKAAPPDAVKRYAKLFDSEFSIYPSVLIQRTKLKRVVFCIELSYAGQRRSAVPDFDHDTLYLDVVRGAYSRFYQREVIHHEFFHIIDFREHFDIYSDPGWSLLNKPDFHYGTGGKNAQGNPNTGVWTTQYPGFLDQYSTTGVEEDKAEVFAAIMVDPVYMTGRIDADPVLAAKVARMKQTLQDFCPAVDASFWGRVSKARMSATAEPTVNH